MYFMEKKKVSIYDIARELNVSPSTVSRSLNDHPRISTQLKEYIQEFAKAMDFSPNQNAVALTTGKVRTIGMVVPMIERNYFVQAIAGVEKEIYKAGYDLIIASSGNLYEREKKIVASMSNGKVEGVIAAVAAETTNYSHYKTIVNAGIPLVMFDFKEPTLDAGSVVQDDYEGAYRATEHLISQGCRTVYHFRGLQNVSIWNDRDRGYRQAMADNNIDINPRYIHTTLTTEEEGRKHVYKMLSKNKLPDGIVFSDDFIAKVAMDVFRDKGLRIPSDIAVVGFMNEPWDTLLNPPLSSVELFSNKIGETAAKMMLELINGMPHRDVVYKPQLIVRESSLRSKYL